MKLKNCVDVATMPKPMMIGYHQLQEIICTSSQQTMVYLVSLHTTIQNKKGNVSMIIEKELVDENMNGSLMNHVNLFVIMISAAMPSRLDTSHAIPSIPLTIGKEITNQITRSL
jgi:hypothetical protein